MARLAVDHPMKVITGDWVRDGLLGLSVVAVLTTAWFGWSWWSSAADERLAVARERDQVVQAGTQALVTLNTVDYRQAEEDIGAWLAVTTGQLGKDLSADKQLEADKARQSKTVATATSRQVAVSELDTNAGTARLLAVLDVHVTTNTEAPADKRSRLTAELNRTDQGWKVNAVQAAGE